MTKKYHSLFENQKELQDCIPRYFGVDLWPRRLTCGQEDLQAYIHQIPN